MKKEAADVYIPAFYAGKSILITGATGFLGKAVIEKLLRSCPEVTEIFVLIRPKKGLSINERLKKMWDNKLFDLLRSKQPSSFDKIIPIAADIAAENLGLLPSDREMLIHKVSIIFHIGASVRFDEELKSMIFSNTRSTRDICVLAQNMEKLLVLVHISSTYVHSDKPVVEEILYPADTYDWKKAIKVAESIDNNILNILTAKYLNTVPNNYIFSKKLSELIISDYSELLPCVIIRPSIVVSTSDDPVKGYCDNFNGPIGMFIGGGKGILRILLSDSSIMQDQVPIDAVVKSLLIVAWKRGIKTLLRLQRKVYVSNRALFYFLIHQWTFHNTKLIALLNDLNVDNRDFTFCYEDIDIKQFFKNAITGAKIYLLNESMDNIRLKESKRHCIRLEWLDYNNQDAIYCDHFMDTLL